MGILRRCLGAGGEIWGGALGVYWGGSLGGSKGRGVCGGDSSEGSGGDFRGGGWGGPVPLGRAAPHPRSAPSSLRRRRRAEVTSRNGALRTAPTEVSRVVKQVRHAPRPRTTVPALPKPLPVPPPHPKNRRTDEGGRWETFISLEKPREGVRGRKNSGGSGTCGVGRDEAVGTSIQNVGGGREGEGSGARRPRGGDT